MNEASIVSAIVADLQNYKVKTQVRRKESQLHVLITRADGDDIDYASLYDIVKRRIDKLPIDGADTLVVYGRLSGSKHPEWHKTADIKPPLPLIELDLEDLEEFDDEDIDIIKNLSFPTSSDETQIQAADLESDLAYDLKGFKSSIDNDLKASGNKAIPEANPQINKDKINNTKTEDFDFGSLELQEFSFEPDQQNNFELEPLDADDLFEVDSQESDLESPLDLEDIENSWMEKDEDFSFDSPTVAAMPMPLPSPPTGNAEEPIALAETEQESIKTTTPKKKSLLLSGAFTVVAISIIGGCGWLVWERYNQQQYLTDARNFSSQDVNPKKITKLETLTETRNRLQIVVSQLEGIPDLPTSLYADAQAELGILRPKLADFDRKINVEQAAYVNLESAKNLMIEAAKLTQNPPHKSTIWQSAQEKRQQALKLLEGVAPDSVIYGDVQQRIKAYRTELVQITRWVEIQQRAESVVSSVSPATVNQLKQLKSKAPEKQKFLPQCQAILQPQISNTESQRTGFPIPTLTSYLCAYFWDS